MLDRRRLDQALDRAVRYRRSQAPERYRDMPNIRERIVGLPSVYPTDLGDGWWRIGAVMDEFAELDAGGLAVHWHPETDRVRVTRPTRYTPRPDTNPTMVPIEDVERGRTYWGYESDRKR